MQMKGVPCLVRDRTPWGEFREGNGKALLGAFHLIKICEDRQKKKKRLAPVLHLFGKFSGESMNV